MELTKEYFDQVVSGLATKRDIEELAGMVQRGFAEVTERLDVREELREHEEAIQRLQKAVGIV
jgi:hypothetical protein